MCGRFYIAEDDAGDELTALIDQLERRMQTNQPDFHIKRGEIFPGDTAAVLAPNRNMEPTAFAMKWGFRMDKKLIFNARCETAAERPLFRESYRLRRCLIPASAYFEWDHREPKPAKYLFWPHDSQMMHLCGLYRIEDDPRTPSFTILTRDAAEGIACFHDRMPVILPPELAPQWLDPNADPQKLIARAVDQIAYRPV